jgi:hypothetical protein
MELPTVTPPGAWPSVALVEDPGSQERSERRRRAGRKGPYGSLCQAALRSWSFAGRRAKLPLNTLPWTSTEACSLRVSWRAMNVLTTA